MSGGSFNYVQSYLYDIAARIEEEIRNNDVYSNDTIVRFNHTIPVIQLAYELIHHIDYLLSGDTNEDIFNRRWKETMENYHAKATSQRSE